MKKKQKIVTLKDLEPKTVGTEYRGKREATVYWCGDRAWAPCPLLEEQYFIECVKKHGYVGVTSRDVFKRLGEHNYPRHDGRGQPLAKFLRDNGLDAKRNFVILFEGSPEDCYRIEALLRPEPNVGLNIQIGGQKKAYRSW